MFPGASRWPPQIIIRYMALERRIYEAIEPVGNADAAAALARDNPDELLHVAIGVGMYSDDLPWAEQFCLQLAQHPHFNVRGNAVLAFGHLARRFRHLGNPASLKAVQSGLVDADVYVRGQAEAAADDLEWFAKLQVRPPGGAI
jgi:hypothetical protein